MARSVIKIVLVRAENPANIGQVARAMKNFGFKDLILVSCADHQAEESYTLGWKAKDILNCAKAYRNLKTAIKKSSLTVGFTRRAGRRRGRGRLLADLIPQMREALRSGNVYLVFGNEKNGLSNDELKYCHELIAIPTTRVYPSLNLSHAVAVTLYAIFSRSQAGRKIKKKSDEFYATPNEFKLLMHDFEKTLAALGYDKSPKANLSKTTLLNLRNFFKRNALEKREYHLFRAFLSRVLNRKRGKVKKMNARSVRCEQIQT